MGNSPLVSLLATALTTGSPNGKMAVQVAFPPYNPIRNRRYSHMKRKRIIPAILTAVLLVVTSLGFTATAASADDEDKPKSVVIHPGG